jgi:hypothetical protein
MGIRCADHSIRKKLALTSPTGGGRSVGIVRSRSKATEFSFYPMTVKRTWSPFQRIGSIICFIGIQVDAGPTFSVWQLGCGLHNTRTGFDVRQRTSRQAEEPTQPRIR